jgi:hypothetical protein
MRKVSKKVKEELLEREEKCERYEYFHDHVCQGRLTWEHAIIYAGRQVDAAWAIIKICAWAHDVDQFQDGHHLDKDKNEFIALRKLTFDILTEYPRNNWMQRLGFLKRKYDNEHNNQGSHPFEEEFEDNDL